MFHNPNALNPELKILELSVGLCSFRGFRAVGFQSPKPLDL